MSVNPALLALLGIPVALAFAPPTIRHVRWRWRQWRRRRLVGNPIELPLGKTRVGR